MMTLRKQPHRKKDLHRMKQSHKRKPPAMVTDMDGPSLPPNSNSKSKSAEKMPAMVTDMDVQSLRSNAKSNTPLKRISICFCTGSYVTEGHVEPYLPDNPYYRWYNIEVPLNKTKKRKKQELARKLIPAYQKYYFLNHGSASLYSRIYVFGGSKEIEDRAATDVNILNTTKETWTWERCPSMKLGKEYPVVVVADGRFMCLDFYILKKAERIFINHGLRSLIPSHRNG